MLTYSKEKRRLDLITISSFDNLTTLKEPQLKDVFPNEPLVNPSAVKFNNKINYNSRPYQFSKEKPIVFISARVHPGETPSSFLMNGIIRFLINKNDPRAEILRKAFVFKIIPMINVDGVSRGFYRYDTNSLNMNRHYISPGIKMQPEIYALKKIFLFYAQENKIKYYFDLHAHASSKGLFLFGNSLDFLPQIENCVFPKLIELNSEDLIYANCNFSEKSMKTRDRGDKYSKEGTGRVHLNKCCEIIHCYTVEASYFRAINKNKISGIKPINFGLLKELLKEKIKKENSLKSYTIEDGKEKEKINLDEIEDFDSRKLLKILSKNLKVDLKNFFKNEKNLIKKITKNNNYKNSTFNLNQSYQNSNLSNYEKIKNINLNVNLSFDTFSKSKEQSIDSSFSSIIDEENKIKNFNYKNNEENFDENKNKINKIKNEIIINSNDDSGNSNNLNEYTEKIKLENKKKLKKTKCRSISNFNMIYNIRDSNGFNINKSNQNLKKSKFF